MAQDFVRRFMFEKLAVRGEIVRLEHSYQSVLERHPYPPVLAALLGTAMAAVSLLGTTIKYQGKLILQIQGKGPANLLVVEYDSEGHIRGLVDWQQQQLLDSDIRSLFSQGHMAITVVPTGSDSAQDKANRYQGIVELDDASLAGCLEHYFRQSEQLATSLYLVADENKVAGFMLQQMPSSPLNDDDWQRLKLLTETLSDEELFNLDVEQLLHRLYGEDDIRLFESEPVNFQCTCSIERIENMLRSLGKAEVEDVLQEQGKIEVACEYCNKKYQLDAVDVAQLFTEVESGYHSTTRH